MEFLVLWMYFILRNILCLNKLMSLLRCSHSAQKHLYYVFHLTKSTILFKSISNIFSAFDEILYFLTRVCTFYYPNKMISSFKKETIPCISFISSWCLVLSWQTLTNMCWFDLHELKIKYFYVSKFYFASLENCGNWISLKRDNWWRNRFRSWNSEILYFLLNMAYWTHSYPCSVQKSIQRGEDGRWERA